jgi:phenylpropionate dioxygenase-like ring-hydroxylating dioxygenase large terminal subunit
VSTPIPINPRASREAGKSTVSDDDIEALLTIGLRNRWHAICPSYFVSHKPISLYRLGLKLVLWRDAAGTVHVQDDHCPHRGAPLSIGRNLGDRLVCIYHGVEIGADGKVLSVPGSPGCKLEGMMAVKTYPSSEVAGAVLAWVGDALHPEPAAYEPPPELVSDEYERFLCYTEWRVPYRALVDNNMDPMHGAFLHRQSHSMTMGSYQAKFQVTGTDHGFRFEKSDQRDVNFDWSEWNDHGAMYVRLDIPYPKTAGPGGSFGIISMSTPISERLSAHFFWRNRKVKGWQRDVWKFLYRNRLEARHWHVLEQDRLVAEGLEVDAAQREVLYDHDVGLIRTRRWMREEARAQLTALAEAGKPMPWERGGISS